MRLALELEQDTSPAGTAETIAAMRAAAASAIAQLPLRFKVETAFRITGRGTVIAGSSSRERCASLMNWSRCSWRAAGGQRRS